jgi:hypothetical protein
MITKQDILDNLCCLFHDLGEMQENIKLIHESIEDIKTFFGVPDYHAKSGPWWADYVESDRYTTTYPGGIVNTDVE